MKECTQQIEVCNDSGEVVYQGFCVLRLAPRAERAALQLKGQKIAETVANDSTEYMAFTEEILDKHLISIDVEHLPSGEKIESREDLRYIEAETLIAHLSRAICGGRLLGKKK